MNKWQRDYAAQLSLLDELRRHGIAGLSAHGVPADAAARHLATDQLARILASMSTAGDAEDSPRDALDQITDTTLAGLLDQLGIHSNPMGTDYAFRAFAGTQLQGVGERLVADQAPEPEISTHVELCAARDEAAGWTDEHARLRAMLHRLNMITSVLGHDEESLGDSELLAVAAEVLTVAQCLVTGAWATVFEHHDGTRRARDEAAATLRHALVSVEALSL